MHRPMLPRSGTERHKPGVPSGPFSFPFPLAPGRVSERGHLLGSDSPTLQMRKRDTSLFTVGLSQCGFIIPKAWIRFAVTLLGLRGEKQVWKVKITNKRCRDAASLAVPLKLPVGPPTQYGSLGWVEDSGHFLNGRCRKGTAGLTLNRPGEGEGGAWSWNVRDDPGKMTALPSHLGPVSRLPPWTRKLIAPLNGDFLLMCAFAVIQDIISGVDTNSPSPLDSAITAFRTLKRQRKKTRVFCQALSRSWLTLTQP